MDFIRKNWSRLSLAFLFFLGGVMAVVAWINNSDYISSNFFTGFEQCEWLNRFFSTALLISTIVFFFGMVCVTITKSLPNSKKLVSCVYMAMGGIVTVLLLVLIIVAVANDADGVLFVNEYWAVTSFYQLWVPFIVFGLYPLIKGVTRFIEAEQVPARVNVQPTAPVTETATAATAAPAKKAAPKTPAAK